MDKYDGWVIKVQWNGSSFFLTWHFRERRTDVVKSFDEGSGGSWRKYRQKGTHKLVKVKLVEVE